MARRHNISVSLTPEQAAFLASCLETGRYQCTSEIIREAVRLLQDHQAMRAAEIECARALILEGAQQLDRGAVVGAEAFFDEWDAELDAFDSRDRSAAG
jgi:antitoxin ParD1/3/4